MRSLRIRYGLSILGRVAVTATVAWYTDNTSDHVIEDAGIVLVSSTKFSLVNYLRPAQQLISYCKLYQIPTALNVTGTLFKYALHWSRILNQIMGGFAAVIAFQNARAPLLEQPTR